MNPSGGRSSNGYTLPSCQSNNDSFAAVFPAMEIAAVYSRCIFARCPDADCRVIVGWFPISINPVIDQLQPNRGPHPSADSLPAFSSPLLSIPRNIWQTQLNPRTGCMWRRLGCAFELENSVEKCDAPPWICKTTWRRDTARNVETALRCYLFLFGNYRPSRLDVKAGGREWFCLRRFRLVQTWISARRWSNRTIRTVRPSTTAFLPLFLFPVTRLFGKLPATRWIVWFCLIWISVIGGKFSSRWREFLTVRRMLIVSSVDAAEKNSTLSRYKTV